MKKIPFFILAVAAAFLFVLPAGAQEKPGSPRTLVFIGQDLDSVQTYVNKTKHVPDGFMVYTSIQELTGLEAAFDNGSGVQHAQGLIDRYPGTQIQIGLYMVGALSDVVGGAYDVNILKLSQWLAKNSATTFYLRIGYEFDYPQNHYAPAAYISAYRYIVDRLRSQGVQNVLYVWHSYAGFVQGSRERWYPGDDYVDWVGLSFFEAYNRGNMDNIVRIARTHNKPLMIAEATPLGHNVKDGAKVWRLWYQKLFDFISARDVRILCYINWDWEKFPMFKGQGWGNGRVEENRFIKRQWLEHVAKNKK